MSHFFLLHSDLDGQPDPFVMAKEPFLRIRKVSSTYHLGLVSIVSSDSSSKGLATTAENGEFNVASSFCL